VHIQNPVNISSHVLNQSVERGELLKLDKTTIENYLRQGVKDEFDKFFNAYLRPLGETALKSTLIWLSRSSPCLSQPRKHSANSGLSYGSE